MKPKRDLLIGVTFLVVLAALAVGQKMLENRAVVEAAGCRRRGLKSTRCGRSRCRTIGCSGNTIGVSVDAQDHVWIIHRAGSLEPKEVYATTNPPTALHAARRRRRFSSSIRRAT